MTATLFDAVSLGDIVLANRIVMAPLTRSRADNDTATVSDLQVEYYRQRATAGLIITEATQITPEGKGYISTPGIYSPEQIAGWRKVTDAVHAEGGKIVVQLWHVGRISHVSLQPDGQAPVAPSAIAADSKTFTPNGFEPTSPPRALRLDEMPRVVADFAHAARAAKEAGFDGVEVHGANGYLIEQFIKDGSNHRDDAYGGPVENRARLLFEVLDAVTEIWGGARTGLRLSPFTPANGISESDPMGTYGWIIPQLNRFSLAYLHMIEGATGGPRGLREGESIEALRALFDGSYMANNGYDRQMAMDEVAQGKAEAVAFGRPFIANPDLVARLRQNAPLAEGDQSSWYSGDAKGYTDYPTLAETETVD